MNTPNDPNNLPDDLHATSDALDRLADRDAGHAPAGLEDRIFVRTRSQIAGASDTAEEGPAPIAKIGPRWWAAAAAIVAIAGASVVFTTSPPPATPDASLAQIESDLDALLSEFDETEVLSTQIESVESDLYALSLNNTWLDLLVRTNNQVDEGA